jgi:putative Mg2+ transporter-C (MgtC) family protein
VTEQEALLRMAAALLAGAIIGTERELLEKPAGVRTYALVCQGSALFMIVSLLINDRLTTAGDIADPTRIASTVVQGVGFIAGGVIFTAKQRVRGLTTAAGLWVVAAIGLFIGSGYYLLGFGASIMTVIALLGLNVVERRLPSNNSSSGPRTGRRRRVVARINGEATPE